MCRVYQISGSLQRQLLQTRTKARKTDLTHCAASWDAVFALIISPTAAPHTPVCALCGACVGAALRSDVASPGAPQCAERAVHDAAVVLSEDHHGVIMDELRQR